MGFDSSGRRANSWPLSERGNDLRATLNGAKSELRAMKRERRLYTRLLIATISACGLCLAALMAKGFGWL